MVNSARPTTRRRVSIESESAAESSPAIELGPPPSTRTDVSTSTTREPRRVSFDAAEETNTTEANSTNLPGPPSQTNQIIEHAQKLDFTLDPRPCLNNDDGNAGFIQLKNTTSNPLPSDQMKIKIGFAAMVFGYDTSLPSLRKQTIINAASRRVYYLHGFNEPPKASRATQKLIDAIIFSAIESLTPIDIPICQPRTSFKKTKIQHIENDHPQFLHKAYRYATRAIGIKASYDDLARVMTQKLKNIF